MRSFKVKHGINNKVFFYVCVYYFGVPWEKLCERHGCLAGSFREIKIFNTPKEAVSYVKKQYGESARIKTTW